MSASNVLSVRVSDDERRLLENAAAQQHSKLSDFVRRKAVEGAELELMGRQIVAIPAAHWEEFELWAKRPPQALPAVNELFSRKAAWGQ